MKTLFKEPLFDTDGKLRLERFDEGAAEVLCAIQKQLEKLGRRMFLPLDLLVELLERGNEELARMVSSGTDGNVGADEVLPRLRVLARELEEDTSEVPPALDRTSFSRGFTRILEEAWEQARGRGEERLTERDLICSVRWRAEVVESASIRWSIQRLSEGCGDELFDDRGMLRMESFDATCEGILRGAMKIAASHGTTFLGTPHFVAMMASIKESVLWRSARARGLQPGRLREELLRLIGSKPEGIPEFHIGRKTLTPRVIRMLQSAVRAAGAEKVTENELVEAFLEDGGSSLELVQALGLEQEVRKALGDPRVLANAEPMEAAIHFAARRAPSPTLDMLGRDLTEEALSGRLPQIVGREKELQRVFNVLMRREQRNPLLTGEAGVGKTALAIGLAQHLANGKGPQKLQGYRVIELNGANLMSGTSYRGDLEARIKNLVEEASHQVILFIDEAHAVFAPRSGSNTPAEVPNHFKSALASGSIAVVGATTEAEYHRWFEQDPALKRRFERIEVAEPERALVQHILTSLVEDLEEDYGVDVDPEAVEHAIELSQRYLPEQRLPDKAKKLLMDACISRANGWNNDSEQPLRVDRQAVAEQVHLKTSIPMERLLRGEIAWWVGLEERLSAALVGQDQAMAHIARGLVTSRLKNSERRRPLGVLAFVGPSGVGKATAARALAREIFYDERALIRLDMTDFQEAHALSRLIGSPPGYVGYEDADMLVTPLRRRPSSVVLFEDFDRAHPRIQDRLLRLLEEGELSDTRGHSADATNAIFVLTISVEGEKSASPIGFGAGGDGAAREVLAGLKDRSLVQRLESRVDEVILFSDLGDAGESGAFELLRSLIDRFVANTRSEYHVELQLGEALEEELRRRVEAATKARQVQQIVDDLLVAPVAEALLAGAGAEKLELCWAQGAVKVVSGASCEI